MCSLIIFSDSAFTGGGETERCPEGKESSCGVKVQKEKEINIGNSSKSKTYSNLHSFSELKIRGSVW